MSTRIRQIVEKFPDLLKHSKGSGELTVTGLNTPELAGPEHLIFVADRNHLNSAASTKSLAWVVHPSLADQVPPQVREVLTCERVQLAMSQIAKVVFPQTRAHLIVEGARIHPSAVVSPRARIGKDTIIGPGAVIGDDCVIGDHCIIGSNSVLEPGVKVGDHTYIHPLVFVGHSCEIGRNCEIQPNTTIGTEGFGYAQDQVYNHHRITHYGRVIIEDFVHIGSGVNIDRGTFADSRIGWGTKIDNHCHFGHNIQIGKNTLITAGMITAGSTTIGSYCVFGGRTTIAGHLSIADKTRIGGMSGITKTVSVPGEYGGLPLQPIKDEIRTRSGLKQLPALVKDVRRILKHLGLNSTNETSTEQ